ncbi:MAG: family 43 glycosylhydrolase [Actinoallomurus sp.]
MTDVLRTASPDATPARAGGRAGPTAQARTFRNPILPGFHPDPSICRVGADYYLVTSSFEWFPGLPIHHSRDLVHWRPLGHVLDRPEQLPLDGIRPSGGPPHLYRVGGFYHLVVAEGGTAHDHAVTVARARAVTAPYEGNPRNPVLTHRHLGTGHPTVATGHADLVETGMGEWWAVLLGIRPSGGYLGNLGRETFLAPVVWEEDWPVIAPGLGRIEPAGTAPALPEHRWPAEAACDNFEDPELRPQWNQLRTPRERFWDLTTRPGHLRLRLRPEAVTERDCPSLIVRRQSHAHFVAQTALDFVPEGPNECAGLVLLQNDDFQVRCVVTRRDGRRVLRLIRRAAGFDETLAEEALPDGRVRLAIEAHDQSYEFRYATPASGWRPIGGPVDGSVLSTEVVGGFIGAFLGMYAASDGRPSTNVADFDWFEYRGLE